MKFKAVLLGLAILFLACTKVEKDERAPVIESLDLNSDSFRPPDVVKITVALSDNENLDQVRVRISPAFAKSFGDWKDLQVRDISGQTYEGSFSFVIPDTARSGYYQIVTQGADLRGNGTKDSILYFTINQPGFAPNIIDFQTDPPIVEDVIYMSGQDSLRFTGLLIDNVQLKEVTFDLRSTNDERIKMLTHDIPDSLTSWDLALNTDTILPDYETKFPGLLLVKVLDNDGNQTRMEVPVDYTP
ncbi:hypothetical protein G3O08_12650 [Cryomorpha ignava]|uniref:DUF4625 domain-containing protein n=1 Tax=Cryomorpha ignava TaxID=101383 RepID=A0A7K3WUL5_9FLAO|nr:hypothetical protein [Cryomorpha ignava]NEN24355.1 hypothetical protein [Cryomorpha ignava]